MKLPQKDIIMNASFFIALLLMTFIFANIFISALSFIFHISVSPLHLVLASLITVALGWWLMRKQDIKVKLGVLSIVFLAVISSIYITSITSDDTVDAHGYHETAVGAMRYGWNPVYEPIGDFNESGKSPVKLETSYYEKWDNHYPKAHWIFAANVYSITNKIETGRSMVLLVIFSLFFLVLHYALTRFSLGLSSVLAVIIALNPISVMQMFSYYNDGMMGNLLLIVILLLAMIIDRKYIKFGFMHYGFIAMALALMMNLKFTGPVYVAVYCVTFLVFVIANKTYRHTVKPLLITGVIAALIGMFVIGLSTYPKNFIEKGNLFYPLIGGGSTDIITENEPSSFHDAKNIKKFLISNFSETDNISAFTGREPDLKVPFTFNKDELTYLSYVDPRIGGYGVWFGGILLISLGWLLYLFAIVILKKDWKTFWYIALPFIPTIIIILVVSEAWWARYLPQLFLVPTVALLSMLLMKRKYLANILIFALLFNTVLILSMQIAGQKEGLAYRASEEKSVDILLENGKYTPKLYLGPFNGLAYRYYEKYGRVITLSEELTGDQAKNSLKLAKNIIVYK
jgi:hypothetical protein